MYAFKCTYLMLKHLGANVGNVKNRTLKPSKGGNCSYRNIKYLHCTEGTPFTNRNQPVKTQIVDFLYNFACNTSWMQFPCNIRLFLALNHDKQILSGFLWVFSNLEIAKIWWNSSVTLHIGVGQSRKSSQKLPSQFPPEICWWKHYPLMGSTNSIQAFIT